MLDIIFLTGHRKSGTTMLHRLFDGHPDIAVYPVDLSVFYAYFPCFVANKNLTDNDLRKRIEIVLRTSLGYVKDIAGVDDKSLDIGLFIKKFWQYMGGRNIKARGDVLYGIAEAWYEYSNSSKKKPILFKETSQAIYFQEIAKAFPSCKFINIVRDPRDNYAALKSGVKKYYSLMGEGELETLASLLNRAKMDLMAAKLYEKEFPVNFFTLKFEDLTNQAEYEMKRITRFAAIEFDACLLQPTVFGKPYAGNSHDGNIFRNISNQNVGKWKERISEFEAQVIEFWLGDDMERWGYQRSFSVKKCAESFAEFYQWYNCRYFFSDSFSSKDRM
jgi:hypothetical protein